MKLAHRLPIAVGFLFCFPFLVACQPAFALQMGQTDYTKAETKTISLRGNLSLIQIKTPDDLNNVVVFSGDEGYLLVDHPEAVANSIVQKELDALGKRRGRVLLKTARRHDPVGGKQNLCRPGELWGEG